MKSSAAPGVATVGAEPRGQMSGWAFWLASHARCLWFVGVSVRLGWKKGSCNQNQSLDPTALKSQDPPGPPDGNLGGAACVPLPPAWCPVPCLSHTPGLPLYGPL